MERPTSRCVTLRAAGWTRTATTYRGRALATILQSFGTYDVMHDYSALPALRDVYLEDSWVTDIVSRPGEIWFELEFVLIQTHPLYSLPAPGEQYCYRRGRLAFGGVTELHWTDQGSPASSDVTGESDFGSIDMLVVEGSRYRAVGDFGTIEFVSDGFVEIKWAVE